MEGGVLVLIIPSLVPMLLVMSFYESFESYAVSFLMADFFLLSGNYWIKEVGFPTAHVNSFPPMS